MELLKNRMSNQSDILQNERHASSRSYLFIVVRLFCRCAQYFNKSLESFSVLICFLLIRYISSSPALGARSNLTSPFELIHWALPFLSSIFTGPR